MLDFICITDLTLVHSEEELKKLAAAMVPDYSDPFTNLKPERQRDSLEWTKPGLYKIRYWTNGIWEHGVIADRVDESDIRDMATRLMGLADAATAISAE